MSTAEYAQQWTPEQQARYAARNLAWTVRVERVEGALVARIVELPDFFAAGANDRDLALNYGHSLESFLLSYFAYGQTPPYPHPSQELPWMNEASAPPIRRVDPRPELMSAGSAAGGVFGPLSMQYT